MPNARRARAARPIPPYKQRRLRRLVEPGPRVVFLSQESVPLERRYAGWLAGCSRVRWV